MTRIIIMAFIAEQTEAPLIKPIRMSVANFEVTDCAMFMIPQVFDQFEFIFVVVTSIVGLPNSLPIHKVLADEGRI